MLLELLVGRRFSEHEIASAEKMSKTRNGFVCACLSLGRVDPCDRISLTKNDTKKKNMEI